jgi:hypothetical protein
MLTLAPKRPRTPSEPWGRNRLLLMLAAATIAAGLLAVGLGMAIWAALGTSGQRSVLSQSDRPAPEHVSVRDRIAAAPMVSLDPEAAFSPDPVTTPTSELRVPIAQIDLGPADVPTGFPHTAEGAVGQLAAIEKVVLESMSLPATRDIHSAWVQPGGPSAEEWELTRNVQSFLAAARQGGVEKDLTTLVSATPAAGLVKGSDGPDWTVVCVLMDVQAVIRTDSRMGYGFCSRMAWNAYEQRWLVAPGVPPAAAPSAWPGSRAAAEAGWQTWIDEAGVR